MKKFLLSILGLALGASAFAQTYQLGEVLDPQTLTEGEHKVIFRGASKGIDSYLQAQAESGTSDVFFGYKNINTDLEEFDETFVYTINVTIEGDQRNFTIKNYLGGYAPNSSTATANVNAKYYSDITDAANAGLYSALYCITNATYQDDRYMLQLNGTSNHVHLNDQWTYLNTGPTGQQDAGGAGRSAAAFKMYEAVEIVEPEPDPEPDPEVQDITQVTNETVGTAITDGAVIALQCVDTSGGRYYYFNGDQAKSATFQYSNLFKVVETEGGIYLQQLSSGKFVGGSSQVELKDTQAEANVFTVSVPSSFGDCKWPTEAVAGVNMIRFTTGSNHLNTNDTLLVPKYAAGTGGYSAWFVFVYSDKAVSDAGKEYLSDKTAKFKEDTPGFYAADEEVTAIIEKVGSDEVMTAEEINAADETLTAAQEAGVSLTGMFGGVYTISNKNSGESRGYLCYVENDGNYVWSSGKADISAPAAEDPFAQWAFVTIKGERVLVNVGSKQFIRPTGFDPGSTENAWIFDSKKATQITLTTSYLGVGTVEITTAYKETEGGQTNTYYMSVNNEANGPVNGFYASEDPGVAFEFERVGDLDSALKTELESSDATTTAIEEITVEAGKVQGIYDLQGRRLSAPVKGINIINGKKVLVK